MPSRRAARGRAELSPRIRLRRPGRADRQPPRGSARVASRPRPLVRLGPPVGRDPRIRLCQGRGSSDPSPPSGPDRRSGQQGHRQVGGRRSRRDRFAGMPTHRSRPAPRRLANRLGRSHPSRPRPPTGRQARLSIRHGGRPAVRPRGRARRGQATRSAVGRTPARVPGRPNPLVGPAPPGRHHRGTRRPCRPSRRRFRIRRPSPSQHPPRRPRSRTSGPSPFASRRASASRSHAPAGGGAPSNSPTYSPKP
jgi:hypothetical protein